MAEIVLIHGIAQEQEGKASLEYRWIPALADGVRAAGHDGLADTIWPAGRPGSPDIQMAYYGDLFKRKGAQGGEDRLTDLPQEEQDLAASLAAEWLTHAAERDNPDQKTAKRQLAHLDPTHPPQGPKEEATRAIINGVAKLKWFAPTGMAFAERFVNKSLKQVTRYLSEPELYEKIQQRVLDLIGPDTKAIIGHSLGSVIAYEIAASHLKAPLPLLLTIGSPLGLQTIIYDRIKPQPPEYPNLVRKWVSIADRNDLVAAKPDLTTLFDRNKPAEGVLESAWTVDNGAKPHQGEYYLRKAQTGKPIAAALDDAATR
ncbi:hypothetical protein ACIP9X_14675 [Arthrobacter sp. NPDC093125]|uniref:hypothetical protein n=1 Tax=Arthrobacter sp. NPDC093125 TaxID=3363944 RepID=UPI0037F11D64